MADCKEGTEETIKDSKPPANMKCDSPGGSSDNSANDEADKVTTEEDSNNSSSSNSRFSNQMSNSDGQSSNSRLRGSILAVSKFGNSFGVHTSNISNSTKPKSSLLRPSALSSLTNSSTSTKSLLQPAKLQNPFTKTANLTEDGESTADSSKEEAKLKESDKDDKDEEKDEEKKEEKKEKEKEKEKEVPKFLALSKSPNTKENENSVTLNNAASASTPSFVFGQNLKERVAVAHDADSSDSSEKDETKDETTNENGSSELMFSNAAAACNKTSTKPGLTLSQAAQEMEEASRANKRKYSEVTLLTGEEDETNVLQINCKLFAFDKISSSYQERGRGSLRLNDKDEESRIIGRAAGTQRLILNTKVWSGMTVERAGPKSVRLTAMDAQGDIKIFVVQANQKEVEQLYNLLLQRLKRAQDRQPKKLATEH